MAGTARTFSGRSARGGVRVALVLPAGAGGVRGTRVDAVCLDCASKKYSEEDLVRRRA